MNKSLLNKKVQDFIRSYSGDLSELAFKGSPFPEISVQELLEQIDGFRRTIKKLPTWHDTENILYPPKLNLEQASSEITADYKAILVSGESLADITGGFGVDTYAFSKKFNKVTYFEQNSALAEVAAHNFSVLGASSINCQTGDGLQGIKDQRFDTIFLDPARRDKLKGKVFRFSDCIPDVVAHFGYLKERCKTLLIKSSPMLDLTEGLRELKKVQQIHVLSVNNEVKEVLWVIEEGDDDPLRVFTANIGIPEPQFYSFRWGVTPEINYAPPQKFLYEPNAALMKAGGYQHLTVDFPVYKIAKNAHLFTSEKWINFPGRRFEILEIRSYGKGSLKDYKHKKAHITIRDFPESVSQLRKKWGIKEGGETYLFFTKLEEGEKLVLICKKR